MSNTVIIVENPSNEYILSHQSQEKFSALREGTVNGVKRLGKRVISFLRRASIHLGTSRSRQAFTPENSKFTLGARGFTMVELAVGLVVLGTIFMSVFKVESMVKNAKIRQTIKQYQDLHAAVLSYRDKYGYLPGDDPNATIHVGASRNGNGDGNIDLNRFAVEFEYELDSLAKAGLIKGASFKNPFGGKMLAVSIFSSSSVPTKVFYYKTGLAIYMLNLPGDVAQSIDTILDDGINNTGSCVTNSLGFAAISVEIVCFIE